MPHTCGPTYIEEEVGGSWSETEKHRNLSLKKCLRKGIEHKSI
jgi:hypothetical protein